MKKYKGKEGFDEIKEDYQNLKTIREKMEAFGMTKDEEIELKRLEEIIGKSIAKEKEGEEK